ncbi:YqaE/Pmp3 family membrane protein [Gramella sp. AN32]|uniref:YqaE/Pmp3 family membrane protein n=1 Tax=Christiangramia antarctica TaxID=2058158 RepID=A0ABW5X9J8_9FLAO|nr:YqaE/Pmp3 family membrane protein [Gramella sp. AN32]MCM4157369.1 YqaE/Pmp3 family membrane protein [Gramella sp. AN32]
MSILTILLNLLLPPLAVFLKHGIGTTFLISVLLTLLGWLPGVVHAFYVNGTE